jgi:transmembrane sensor
MTEPNSRLDEIEEAAAAWDARLRSERTTAAEREAYRVWRLADPAHEAAYERLAGALGALRELSDRPELRALRDESRAGVRRVAQRRWLWAGGVAASVAALIVGAAAVVDRGSPLYQKGVEIAQSAQGAKTYRTALNERSTVTLADGSTVTLDSETRLLASFAPTHRDITLLEGRALFRVAKDPTRPFVVRAGDRTVTALGTVFDVRLDDGKVKVTLVEGKVSVRRLRGGFSAPAAGDLQVMAPHQQLQEMADARPPLIRTVDVDKALSWTEGRVFFEDEPLAAAVQEMNRYAKAQIVIADPALGDLRINGMFRAGNQTGFVGALQTTLPVEVHADDQGRLLVEARREGASQIR